MPGDTSTGIRTESLSSSELWRRVRSSFKALYKLEGPSNGRGLVNQRVLVVQAARLQGAHLCKKRQRGKVNRKPQDLERPGRQPTESGLRVLRPHFLLTAFSTVPGPSARLPGTSSRHKVGLSKRMSCRRSCCAYYAMDNSCVRRMLMVNTNTGQGRNESA